MELDLQVQGNN